MNFQFTHPIWLVLLPAGLAWTLWLAWKSDAQLTVWRRHCSTWLRVLVVCLLALALAGLQWLLPREGMNVFYVLDRSDSVPSEIQQTALDYVNKSFGHKKEQDKAGVLVFGSDAALEFAPNPVVNLEKIHAVIQTERTDLAAAIRLATAAFPESGQRRVVVVSDGNENVGDALGAALAATPLGVSIDVVPVGSARGNDLSVQKLTLPNTLKKGQTFDVKIFVQSDVPQQAVIRLFRNDQFLDSQMIDIAAGKNLLSFPQRLDTPGFYSYDIQAEAPRDMVPQNNRAVNFTYVRGDPSVLLISSNPAEEGALAQALADSKLSVKLADLGGFPSTLSEIQSYDAIFLSNIAAGDLGFDTMRLLESAVRDFGVGLVVIGGDQSFAAGGYRNTPLEAALPVDMELNSKKVLPSGAMVLVVHATEFPNGNQWARDIAFAALQALGPTDEMGIILWDGSEKWLFELQKVGDKKNLGRAIAGMNPGDMVAFGGAMEKAHEALKKSTSSLKHMVVFSDGDPSAPSSELVTKIVTDKITMSTVMIGGHVAPDSMTWMAEKGKGRFYDVRSPQQLPQIFVKEAAVILKSAIFEEPFKPRVAAPSEILRGIGGAEIPSLLGYVATTAKPRAEVALVSEKGDPVLAQWQYGLGRAVAFTSDAKQKWAQPWMDWAKYRQFWSQAAQWALRKIENVEYSTEITVDRGEGVIHVEALDQEGNFRNFLNLETTVVSPKGERQRVRLTQSGSGHYEARFDAREVGAYLLNLMEMRNGQLVGSQVLGASVNYSPEFSTSEPNLSLMERLAEAGGGKVLDLAKPGLNPFEHDRLKTFQPFELWEWLLRIAILLFPLDVAVRRIQIDRDEWLKATENLRRILFFWRRPGPRLDKQEEALGALLARKQEVRATKTAAAQPNPDLFKPVNTPVVVPSGAGKPAATPDVGRKPAPAGGAEAPKPAGQDDTTSRLLQAKRRAQKK